MMIPPRVMSRVGAALIVAALSLSLSACSGSNKKDDENLAAAGQSHVPPQEAIKRFEEAAKLYESSGGKNLEQVEDRLRDAVEIDPKFARAWFNLGVLYAQRGERDKARESYEMAAKTSTTLAAPHVNLGKMAWEDGREEDAWSQFQKAVEKDSFNSQAHNNISVILRRQANRAQDEAKFKEAISHARRSLAGDAQNTGAYTNLALIYYQMGLNDVAKLVILNALKISEQNPDLWNTYGLIELKNNDVTSAIAYFTKALALKPDHVEAMMNLGAVVLSVRDYERAIGLFEQVLKIKPDDDEALISIAVAKRGTGDLEQAEKIYMALLEKNSNNPLALFNLGVLEHEHMAQSTMLGLNGDPPPEDPVQQMEWNIKNMTSAVQNYEKARDYYVQFAKYYKGERKEYVKEAEDRIQQVQELIDTTRTQVELMKQQKEELAADMALAAQQEKEAAEAAAREAAAQPAPEAPAP